MLDQLINNYQMKLKKTLYRRNRIHHHIRIVTKLYVRDYKYLQPITIFNVFSNIVYTQMQQIKSKRFFKTYYIYIRKTCCNKL